MIFIKPSAVLACGAVMLAAASLSCGLSGDARAQNLNTLYIEATPQPLTTTGDTISTSEISALANSDFTTIIFAFLNYCDPVISGGKPTSCKTDPQDPKWVWNLYDPYDQGGVHTDLAKAIQALADNGKAVYLSIGAGSNPETFNYFTNHSGPDIAKAMAGLTRFMKDYHVTGIDLDYEDSANTPGAPLASNTTGFITLASEIAALSPRPPVSIAPYTPSDSDPGEPELTWPLTAGITADAFTSVRWQTCALLNAGLTASIINRQYYSGGFVADVPAAVAQDLQPFACPTSATCGTPGNPACPSLSINAGTLAAGLAPGQNCQTAPNAPSSRAARKSCAR
ncbi:glycosyl hydrolase family 18 protein [Breoghania sp. L-A4]|uniref:glycosyl hydrolase family 18 protein n=1 Tax=Breoghania sp. L-A4 TaxID=2304600 RepID=UPI000E3608E7|nr:glycosyl hydrolase family 18 protein [Breoghania sp. L-A4]AXS39837.1 hypothetical protein D1F64_06960 [Breoghania sp. L-A4]